MSDYNDGFTLVSNLASTADVHQRPSHHRHMSCASIPSNASSSRRSNWSNNDPNRSMSQSEHKKQGLARLAQQMNMKLDDLVEEPSNNSGTLYTLNETGAESDEQSADKASRQSRKEAGSEKMPRNSKPGRKSDKTKSPGNSSRISFFEGIRERVSNYSPWPKDKRVSAQTSRGTKANRESQKEPGTWSWLNFTNITGGLSIFVNVKSDEPSGEASEGGFSTTSTDTSTDAETSSKIKGLIKTMSDKAKKTISNGTGSEGLSSIGVGSTKFLNRSQTRDTVRSEVGTSTVSSKRSSKSVKSKISMQSMKSSKSIIDPTKSVQSIQSRISNYPVSSQDSNNLLGVPQGKKREEELRRTAELLHETQAEFRSAAEGFQSNITKALGRSSEHQATKGTNRRSVRDTLMDDGSMHSIKSGMSYGSYDSDGGLDAGGEDQMGGRGFGRMRKSAVASVVRTQYFETFIGLIILTNTIMIGVEAGCATQNKEIENGIHREDHNQGCPSNSDFAVLEHVFLAIYVVELMLRFFITGIKRTLCTTWGRFDAVLVAVGIISTWIILPVFGATAGTSQTRILVVAKILRLIRLVRALRLFVQFRHAWMLVRGLYASAFVMIWAFLLIMILLFFFAVLGIDFIGSSEALLSNPETAEYAEQFEQLDKAIITLSSCWLLDQCAVIYSPLIQAQPSLSIYFLLVVMVLGVCCMSLITAILVQNSIESTTEDKDAQKLWEAQRKKHIVPRLIALFNQLDVDGSGDLSKAELLEASADIKNALSKASKFEDVVELFEALDVDNSGSVEIDEFCLGIFALAEKPDKPIEFLRISKRMQRFQELLDRVEEKIERRALADMGFLDEDAGLQLMELQTSEQHFHKQAEGSATLKMNNLRGGSRGTKAFTRAAPSDPNVEPKPQKQAIKCSILGTSQFGGSPSLHAAMNVAPSKPQLNPCKENEDTAGKKRLSFSVDNKTVALASIEQLGTRMLQLEERINSRMAYIERRVRRLVQKMPKRVLRALKSALKNPAQAARVTKKVARATGGFSEKRVKIAVT